MYYIRKLYELTRWYVDAKLIKIKDEKIINFLYNLHNFKRTFNISKLTKKKKKKNLDIILSQIEISYRD